MSDFTVVTTYSPSFSTLAAGLREDCHRWGYQFHEEAVEREFDHLIAAFDYKISFIRRMLDTYEQILWLDAECRIVKEIPDAWRAPLISSYTIGTDTGYSSGVLMLNRAHREFTALWEKYALRHRRLPDDFVFEFLVDSTGAQFHEIPFSFYDRTAETPVARGMWTNHTTVIQHPTINRWPNPLRYRRAFTGSRRMRHRKREAISRQRKALYYRNFGGSFEAIDQMMRGGVETEFVAADWVFDAVQQRYAPSLYWPDLADDFTSKPRSFQKSQHNFEKRPKGSSFRERSVRRMRLLPEDAHLATNARFVGSGSWWARLIRSKSR